MHHFFHEDFDCAFAALAAGVLGFGSERAQFGVVSDLFDYFYFGLGWLG